MDIAIYIFVFIMIAAGFAGCFIPVIPGPPLAFIGYLLLLLTPATVNISWTAMVIAGVLTLVSVVFDFIVPTLGVKWFGGTKWGKWGSVFGTVAGLFAMPWGILVGPFLGAFLGEIIGNAHPADAFKSAFGSLLGFLCGAFFKLIVTTIILFMALRAIIA